MKKNIIALLLAAVFALGLAGCSMGGDTSPSPSASPSASPDGGVVGDIVGDVGDVVDDITSPMTSGEPSGTTSDEPGILPDGDSPDYSGVTDVAGFADAVAAGYSNDLPSMMDLDDQTLQDLYGIDPALLDEYVARIPMMNVHATELFAAKVKSGEMESVVNGIESRVAALEDIWSQYLPDQYELVRNYKLVQEGDYVLFVVSAHAEEIAQGFSTAFGA